MRVCLGTQSNPCARLISKGSRCSTCKREFQRQRKAKGLTGERGFYCTAPASIEDHYIPKAEGGSDEDSNMVAACQSCNSAKSDQTPDAFLASEWLKERRRGVAERG